MQAEPRNVECYLNLGRVYLRSGLKLRAVEVFRKGLSIDNKNPEIIAELRAMGLRNKSIISSLPRDNFLNKHLGKIFAKLGLR